MKRRDVLDLNKTLTHSSQKNQLVCCRFFIFKLGWGLDGAAIATSLAYTLMFLMLLAHVWTSRSYDHAKPPLDFSRAFQKAGLFLQLGTFSTIMMWWVLSSRQSVRGFVPFPVSVDGL